MRNKIRLADKEEENFILAIELLTEKDPRGPSIGDIFYYLIPDAQSTQIKGRNRGDYDRLLRVAYYLLDEKKIDFVLEQEGQKKIKRYKVASINIKPIKDNIINQEQLSDILNTSIHNACKIADDHNLHHIIRDGQKLYSENEVYECLSLLTTKCKGEKEMKSNEKIHPTKDEVYEAFEKAIKDHPKGVSLSVLRKYLPNPHYETVNAFINVLITQQKIIFLEKVGPAKIYGLPEIKNKFPNESAIQKSEVKQARVIECEVCPHVIIPSPAQPKLYNISCPFCETVYQIAGDMYYRLCPGKKIFIWGPIK